MACCDGWDDTGSTSAPPEPRGGEGLTSTERLHDVIGKLRRHIDAIQEAKRRVEAGGKLGRPDPLLACVNDLPAIVHELDMAELEIEADFEAHEDRPTAPSASGGEAVAWLTAGGDVTRSRAYAVEQSVNDPANYPVALFAHPARMPTREEVFTILRRWCCPTYAEHGADAILALFQKGDGRG